MNARIPPTTPPRCPIFDTGVGSFIKKVASQLNMKRGIATANGRVEGKNGIMKIRPIAMRMPIMRRKIGGGRVGMFPRSPRKEVKVRIIKMVGIFSNGFTRDATAMRPKIEPEPPIKGRLKDIPKRRRPMMSNITATFPEAK